MLGQPFARVRVLLGERDLVLGIAAARVEQRSEVDLRVCVALGYAREHVGVGVGEQCGSIGPEE
jgi:hypothetical protein